MKKWLCLILSILMVLVTFSACSKSGGSDDDSETSEKEGSGVVDSSSEKAVAEAYIKAVAIGDQKTEIELHMLDLDISEKAMASEAAEEGMTSEEYYSELSDELFYYYENGEIDEEPNFDDYDGYISFYTLISKSRADDELSDYFGIDYEITIEIGDKIEADEDDIAAYREDADEAIADLEYEYSFDIDLSSDDIDEFAIYEYKITVKGSENEETAEGNLIILGKINGEWKVIDCEM